MLRPFITQLRISAESTKNPGDVTPSAPTFSPNPREIYRSRRSRSKKQTARSYGRDVASV